MQKQINPKRIGQYLNNAVRALKAYHNDEPFANFLRRYFKANRQMGSKDRRMLSQYCYGFFRLGGALSGLPIAERIVIGEFLTQQQSDLVTVEKADWVGKLNLSTAEKLDFLKQEVKLDENELFPNLQEVSSLIDKDKFLESQFSQPLLFIRVKPGKEAFVRSVLERNNLKIHKQEGATFALDNRSKLDDIKEIRGLYEVQDLSSQKTLDYIPAKDGEFWWDACAGAGGKSLMLLENYPKVNLFLSDIRERILENLKTRLQEASIHRGYQIAAVDLLQPIEGMEEEIFDGIIVDAPCSGSGTWNRTPEMKTQERSLEEFHKLQLRLLNAVLPYLKEQGKLIYITCSVYEKENQAVVQSFAKEHNLKVAGEHFIQGFQDSADTLFIAELSRP